MKNIGGGFKPSSHYAYTMLIGKTQQFENGLKLSRDSFSLTKTLSKKYLGISKFEILKSELADVQIANLILSAIYCWQFLQLANMARR